MIVLMLTALVALPSQTWTVDDNGPADFAQIAEAIAQVPAGDTLLVEPGVYGPFELTKRLTLLGRAGGPRPHVEGFSRVSASTFTLAGLDLDALLVTQVSGRGRLDDCRVGVSGDAGREYALELDGCAQMVLSRIEALGSKDHSQAHPTLGGSALRVRTSNATLVDCSLEGAKGYDPAGFGLAGGPGGTGLAIADASRVTVAAPRIVGGPEGWGTGFIGCQDGQSGTGLRVVGSTAVLRGSPLYANLVEPGWVDGLCTNYIGPAIDVVQGTVVISGVSFDPANVVITGGTLLAPAAAEPFVVIEGTDVPGGQREVRIHGPAGAPCLLAISPAPAYATLGGFDDKLWVGLSGVYFLIPLVTTGQSTPVVLTWDVPASTASLLGLSVELQPFFPGLPSAIEPGKSVAGNVAELIVRF
ncbi:MAG TPA: hypothetical protein VFD43_10850 [Planctomycetota bacterium]|nr:hypothetical protein [Planctomycetota bacterium]